MAVTIMFGLAFGTILTMVLVPVLYALLYRLEPPDKAGQVVADAKTAETI
jgi:Cu/Ag efflux pump CusA